MDGQKVPQGNRFGATYFFECVVYDLNQLMMLFLVIVRVAILICLIQGKKLSPIFKAFFFYNCHTDIVITFSDYNFHY